MSPKIFRKISHSGPGICLYLSNLSKEVSQLTDWQTYKTFRIIWKKCTHIPGMPPNNFRRIYHTELEISLYLSNFSKRVSQQIYWQRYKKSELFGTSVPTSLECLQTFLERYMIQNWIYPYICLILIKK